MARVCAYSSCVFVLRDICVPGVLRRHVFVSRIRVKHRPSFPPHSAGSWSNCTSTSPREAPTCIRTSCTRPRTLGSGDVVQDTSE